MRETLFVRSARNISAPLLAEITELLKRNLPPGLNLWCPLRTTSS